MRSRHRVASPTAGGTWSPLRDVALIAATPAGQAGELLGRPCEVLLA
jgi:hypothetical protein